MFILDAIVAIIVILLTLTAWWYYILFKNRKFLKQFPMPTQLPLLGYTYKLRNTVDLYYVIESEIKTLGKNFFAMIGPIPTLFTADPKIFSLILGPPKHINKPERLSKMLSNSIANSLIAVNGDEWRKQRKFLNPALDYTSVIENINVFNEKSNGLIKRLEVEINNESTEMGKVFGRYTLEQAYESLLGDTVLTDKTEFLSAVRLFMKICMDRAISPTTYLHATYVFTKTYWKERKTLKILFDHVRELIRKKKIELHENKIIERRPILIDILINHMENDKNITEDFVSSQLIMMLAAAFDTTATTLSFLLYHLSIFPEIQQKAYDEVFAMLGDDINQPITNHHVKEMKYLDLVIKESMRMKASAPLFVRTLNEDINYEGTILPKGLMVLMLPFMMHMDPDVYPEPEKFIPERFLVENLNPNRYSYAPFNAGIRNCIGQKFAMLSMHVVLAKLLLNYEFVEVKQELILCAEITLRSKTGIKVGIRKRNK
ncbi:cytochrome P450 4V2-like [Onthophagus taurus]|uniref:cytochrome P450 4V2-like n=1 Tax=Onthophagus taurus TaxID=166361 RepID=UPI0039BDC601